MTRTLTTAGEIVAEIEKTIEGRNLAEVSEFRREVERTGLFSSEEFKDFAVKFAQTELIRRALRRKGTDGYPLFPNVVFVDEQSGKRRQLYMREKHMKPPQYVQVADRWTDYSHYGARMANETIKRCNARYQTQLELPFPEAEAA